MQRLGWLAIFGRQLLPTKIANPFGQAEKKVHELCRCETRLACYKVTVFSGLLDL